MTTKSNIIFSILFAALISLPLLVTATVGTSHFDATENRQLAAFPKYPKKASEVGKFISGLNKYYSERFGLRQQLIRIHNHLIMKIFDVSPTPKVILGRRGWLYYNGGNVIDDYIARHPLPLKGMDALRRELEERKAYLNKRNIKYFFVVVPNKSTIYPEYLPVWIRRSGNRSHLDQFITYMRNNSNVRVLDLRSALKKAKKNHQVYLKGGTHWNCIGAYTGYREILRSIGQQISTIKPIPLDHFLKIKIFKTDADLTRMASMSHSREVELSLRNSWQVCPINIKELSRLRNKKSSKLKINIIKEAFRKDGKSAIDVKNLASKNPKLLMMHDSFGNDLIGLMARHWSESAFIYYGWDEMEAATNLLKPNVVIDETVERFLWPRIRRRG